jgi:tRNA threonylcarbamoyladenosine biosynthesis protein TsaE
MAGAEWTTPDWVYPSDSPERTEALARGLARRVKGGELFLLKGPLGAGKTLFASAFAAELGVAEAVVSPTFVLLRSYPTMRGLKLHHLDFYRLEGERGAETLGVEELVNPRSVTLVEWPERCPAAFDAMTLELTFQVTGERTRMIEGRWGELPFATGTEFQKQ